MRALILTAVAAATLAGPVAAQTPNIPPVPTIVPAVDDVLTWEELPLSERRRYDPLIEKTAPQAVLHVMNAVVADADYRMVDHGDVLIEQFVRPAGLARITRPVRNANKYGPMGAALWPGVDGDSRYWCWKRPGPLRPHMRNNWYCYQDDDGDGTSERLMENTLWQSAPILSHFQFTNIGRDEGVRESASFVVEPGALGEMEERVVLRYFGVTRAHVRADGSLSDAAVQFELLTGPDPENLGVVKRIEVQTDASGRGEYSAPNGIRLRVDGVNLDGTARVQVLSGLPTGRALLFAPFSREFVLEYFRGIYNPDGSPKAGFQAAP